MPELSFLIATHNRLDLTQRCLETLEVSLEEAPDYEIIIVDDCSTDGTAEFLKGLGAPYRVLHNAERGSFALNNNRAAEMAQSATLLFEQTPSSLANGGNPCWRA